MSVFYTNYILLGLSLTLYFYIFYLNFTSFCLFLTLILYLITFILFIAINLEFISVLIFLVYISGLLILFFFLFFFFETSKTNYNLSSTRLYVLTSLFILLCLLPFLLPFLLYFNLAIFMSNYFMLNTNNLTFFFNTHLGTDFLAYKEICLLEWEFAYFKNYLFFLLINTKYTISVKLATSIGSYFYTLFFINIFICMLIFFVVLISILSVNYCKIFMLNMHSIN